MIKDFLDYSQEKGLFGDLPSDEQKAIISKYYYFVSYVGRDSRGNIFGNVTVGLGERITRKNCREVLQKIKEDIEREVPQVIILYFKELE